MSVLAAYCDDSDLNLGRLCSVAAVLSVPDGWVVFEESWMAVLGKYGVPYFRASEFDNRMGPFEGWDNARRLEFHCELLDVVRFNDPRIAGFAWTVEVAAFERLANAERERLGSPFQVCAEWTIRAISRFLDESRPIAESGIPVRVAYCFDRHPGIGGLIQSFERARKRVAKERRIASLAFGDKKEFCPIQAADILAYESGKSALRELGVVDKEPRKSLERLRETMYLEGYLIGLDAMREVLRTGYDDFARPDQPVDG